MVVLLIRDCPEEKVTKEHGKINVDHNDPKDLDKFLKMKTANDEDLIDTCLLVK